MCCSEISPAIPPVSTVTFQSTCTYWCIIRNTRGSDHARLPTHHSYWFTRYVSWHRSYVFVQKESQTGLFSFYLMFLTIYFFKYVLQHRKKPAIDADWESWLHTKTAKQWCIHGQLDIQSFQLRSLQLFLKNMSKKMYLVEEFLMHFVLHKSSQTSHLWVVCVAALSHTRPAHSARTCPLSDAAHFSIFVSIILKLLQQCINLFELLLNHNWKNGHSLTFSC